MSKSKILFAALLFGTLISSNAHAVTLEQSLGTVSATNGFVYNTVGPDTSFNYAASGVLPANSEIIFTYSANMTGGYNLAAGGNNVVANASVASFGGPQTSSPAPVIAYANLGAGAASISIDNTTSTAESFKAMFSSFFASGNPSSFTIGREVSAVPLPASFMLFGTGLVALFGFSALRKNRDTI